MWTVSPGITFLSVYTLLLFSEWLCGSVFDCFLGLFLFSSQFRHFVGSRSPLYSTEISESMNLTPNIPFLLWVFKLCVFVVVEHQQRVEYLRNKHIYNSMYWEKE